MSDDDDNQPSGAATLTRDQLIHMMTDMAEVRSVELKMTVPADQRMAMSALDLDPLRGKLRQVYFFDTPDLDLFKSGWVLRARRTQGADADTAVKLRPAIPNELPADVRSSRNLKIEMDVTRGSYVVSASLKGTRPSDAVQEALRGERPLKRLFTKEQRSFFATRGSTEPGWDDLVPLGPILVVFLKFTPRGLKRRLTIEQWHYPGEVPLVEISTKATPHNAFEVFNESTGFLRIHGLSASGAQEPKTRRALEFYAKPIVDARAEA
ncbi:MAG TPA: hypothetical protein VEX15_09240 [Nocardioidaceae bacterium]|nr:hypothetical protein [Nocardioidaceae bacterium]